MADERCTPPGPTLAEMVERLRTCADVAPLPVVADALTEIDRRLTALEASKWEGLFRLHDRAALRDTIANSDAPQICDAYEPADRPGYDACARCGWSSRIHDGLPRDRKARAWAAYLDSCRRSRLRSKAYLGRALPDVRR